VNTNFECIFIVYAFNGKYMNGLFVYSQILQQGLTIQQSSSPEVRDMITKLLQKSPMERLGGEKGDALKIKRHPFFSVSSFHISVTIQ
jgi:hypothetical protein